MGASGGDFLCLAFTETAVIATANTPADIGQNHGSPEKASCANVSDIDRYRPLGTVMNESARSLADARKHHRASYQTFETSLVVIHVLCKSWWESGKDRMRFPVAEKIALHTAGAKGRIAGSP